MSVDPEKIGTEHIERTISEESNDAHISEFTPMQQKRIIRRVDFRLVTTLGFLYMCSLMDRTNLGAANIAGYVCIPPLIRDLLTLDKYGQGPQTRWISVQPHRIDFLYSICTLPATSHGGAS
jgi:hypothetical protein